MVKQYKYTNYFIFCYSVYNYLTFASSHITLTLPLCFGKLFLLLGSRVYYYIYMKALYLKEITGFFASLSGWVVIIIFLVLNGLFLWLIPGADNIPQSGYAQMDGLFTLSPWLFLFLVPAISMRMFADEYKSGTWELLLTRPVPTHLVVVAKYLACLTLIVLSIIPTLVYFLSVWWLRAPGGYVDTGAVWGSYIGLIFLASVYTALGLLASSLTDNILVAFILAAVLCVTFYAGFDLPANLIPDSKFGEWIALPGIAGHYRAMSHGVIDSRDVAYFVLFSFLALSATTQIVRTGGKKF